MKLLLTALHYLHKNNIIHRDLKPDNILLRNSNNYESAIIADLGLAIKSTERPYLFPKCGTPGYVAPEVINIEDLNDIYDPVCDVFSLGVIFH